MIISRTLKTSSRPTSIRKVENHLPIAGISLSCLSNIGLTIGNHGCNIPWSDMPAIGKWFSTFLMLVGRLEVFSVLLIITPAFWKHN